jgi:uncharacterized protein YjbI with pentapeptide repeats
MFRIICIITLALICLMLVQVLPVSPQQEQQQKDWTGKLSDGTVITKRQMDNILEEHKKWVESEGREGRRGLLQGADLRGADLSRAFLRGADLRGANLNGAKLAAADLSGAKLNANLIGDKPIVNLAETIPIEVYLRGADLRGADLSGADLSKANLSGAYFSAANLSQADLYESYLSGTNFFGANLAGSDLSGANLSGADMYEAYLSESNFIGAYMSRADLRRANLKRANLYEADLTKADLYQADLSGVDLSESYLIGTYLSGADLKGADLSGAYLSGADLRGANLSGVIFEPNQESVPKIKYIDFALNLFELKYLDSPKTLVILREEFKKSGLRRQEREITRAIKHTQMLKSWEEKSLFKKIEAVFSYVFFELTCQYGMRPGRPLIILMGLIPLFSLLYIFALKTKRQKTGIWIVFLKERVVKATKGERPFKLTANFPPRVTPTGKVNKIKFRILRWYRMIRLALYFSLLSATSIGWREFNIDNWITRIQRREYILRATGWVRAVSGLQSLISVYCLALWALTYFGRPFEAL